MSSASKTGTGPALQLQETASFEHRQVVLDALIDYNRATGPDTRAEWLAILVLNDEGEAVGGLWGKTIYDWLVIELVAVPETMRGEGLGSKLMLKAEQEAQRRGCIGAWLDTFSFQARGFYERLGYSVSGAIEDHPVGGARFIMSKRFA
jgi:GNAT superfamily N-acetyltransferase